MTLDLGPRTDQEIEARLRHDVGQERLTAIDRRLLRRMDADRTVSPADNDPFQQSVAAGRLRKLTAMDLAEDIGAGRYRLAEGLEDTLRRMGERGDIIRTMQRELTARRLDRAGVEQVIAADLREPLVGRLIHRGLSDELRDRHFVMIDGVDGRVHYVDIGRGIGTPPMPEGATVRMEPTQTEATQADRTVDAVARVNGGRYSIDLHLAHDPRASVAYAASHVRRLEAMRRARAGPERMADGSWAIPQDHLARAEAFTQRQQRDRPVALSILSPTPVAKLAAKEAPTWLDSELEEGSPISMRNVGFGREVRTALAARRQWLLEQQLADGDGRILRLRNGALESLRQRELEDAGGQLARKRTAPPSRPRGAPRRRSRSRPAPGGTPPAGSASSHRTADADGPTRNRAARRRRGRRWRSARPARGDGRVVIRSSASLEHNRYTVGKCFFGRLSPACPLLGGRRAFLRTSR